MGRAVKTQSEDAQGDVFTETIYDALGRISKTSGAYRPGDTKQWVETIYDGLGRTREIISPKIGNEATPAKITVDYSVSQFGVVHVGTNQAGKKVRSITNGLDQLVRVDEPTFDTNDLGAIDNPSQSTSYKYDALGNLRQVLQGSQSRFYLYDSLGRLLRIKEPEQDNNSSLEITDPVTNNGQWSTGFTYDANGNLLTTNDAKGVVTSVSYDKLDRVYQRTYSIPQTSDPKKITVATSTVSFKYDGLLSPSPNDANPAVVALAKGAVTEVSNSSSVTQFTSFDAVGHVRGSRQITDGRVYSFSYEYNLAGALKSEVYPSGRTVTNGFDGFGDLSTVSSNLPNQTAITYASDFHHLPNGTVDQFRLGNGRWETYKTNARQQITQIALGTSATDTSLWKVDYDYGLLNQDGSVDVSKDDGKVAKQTITVPGVTAPFVQKYKYDFLNRLQEVTETTNANENWKQIYAYDRFGNRTGLTYNINGSAVSLNSTNNPTIDSSTNRISGGQGYDHDFNGNVIQDSLGRKFGFDADNRQRTLKDSANQVIASYDYDGSGRRIKKTNAAGQQTVFVYDASGRLVAEYSNETTSTFGRSYITADILNSPRVISNSNGDVTSRRDFMPFGESITVARSGNQKYGVNDGLRQNFSSKERDNESGLDFFEARYYASMHGRFTSPDISFADQSAENPQSWNLYSYVRNSPLIMIDPTGRFGDYYNKNGSWDHSDGKNDNKVYVINETTDSNGKVTRTPQLLSITHSEFARMANIVRHEGITRDPDEYIWIAHATNNEANAIKSTFYNVLMSGFSSVAAAVKRTGLPTNDSSVQANASRAGVIGALTGATDPTDGARRWDGTDFLAWGLKSPNGTPHNKFEEFSSITIPGDIYNTFEGAQMRHWGKSVTYSRPTRKKFAIPADVFKDLANWRFPCEFYYVTGAKGKGVQGPLTATGAKGESIFWKF